MKMGNVTFNGNLIMKLPIPPDQSFEFIVGTSQNKDNGSGIVSIFNSDLEELHSFSSVPYNVSSVYMTDRYISISCRDYNRGITGRTYVYNSSDYSFIRYYGNGPYNRIAKIKDGNLYIGFGREISNRSGRLGKYDIETNTEIILGDFNTHVFTLAFSENYLYATDYNGTTRQYDLSTNTAISGLDLPNGVYETFCVDNKIFNIRSGYSYIYDSDENDYTVYNSTQLDITILASYYKNGIFYIAHDKGYSTYDKNFNLLNRFDDIITSTPTNIIGLGNTVILTDTNTIYKFVNGDLKNTTTTSLTINDIDIKDA